MTHILMTHARRSIATSALVLLLTIASACSAPVRSPAARPSPRAVQVALQADTPSPLAPDRTGGAAGPAATLDARRPAATSTAAATAPPPPTAVPATATATATLLPYLGKETLDRWRQRLTEVRAGAPHAQATLALVGDSWIDGDVVLGVPLRATLQAKYGDGGAGLVEFGGGADAKGAPHRQDIAYERTGSWTVRDAFTDPRGGGVDLADASSTDTSTPGAIMVTGAFSEVILHYIKQPGGGSFRWRADSGPWREVSTAAPRLALATERIGNLAAGRHTVKIEVRSAGAAGVRLAGADLRKPGGVRVNRAGMNGATALDYARADAGLWQAGLSALNPDLVVLLLGTNDDARQRLPSDYRDDMETIVGRIRSAVPLAGILLLAPGDNNLKASGRAPLGIDEYNAQLRALATKLGVAFLDASQVLGPFPDANARGLYHDDIHLNEEGGKVLTGYLLENLLDGS